MFYLKKSKYARGSDITFYNSDIKKMRYKSIKSNGKVVNIPVLSSCTNRKMIIEKFSYMYCEIKFSRTC